MAGHGTLCPSFVLPHDTPHGKRARTCEAVEEERWSICRELLATAEKVKADVRP